MRRKDRELTEEGAYGMLSLVTADGAPYAVPHVMTSTEIFARMKGDEPHGYRGAA